jgi:hypothetical protein
MKKLLKSKKGIALLATMVVAIAAAVGAYAYFTSSGNGTGSATVGTDAGLVVTQTGAAPSGLVPDGAPQDITIHVANSASFDQSLSAIHVTVQDTDLNGDPITWDSVDGCSASDFTVTDPTITPETVIAAGDSQDFTATIQMDESSSNQDGCKLATVPLYFSAT